MIDYVIASENSKRKVIEFKVGSRIKSDHLPLEVEIEENEDKEEDKEEDKKKRIKRRG